MANLQFSRKPQTVPAVETRYRRIKTQIPAPGTEALLSELDRYESRSMHGQLPIVWDRATDFNVWDHAGNQWIDFTSTIFVTNVGHGNPRVARALRDTIDHGLLHSYAYANRIRAKYLKKLVDFAPASLNKAFLLSAGTEATEAALKLMRMNGQRKDKRRLGVICIEGNWHGRTMGAQMMSSNAGQKAWIGYQDPNIHHIRFPYPWAMDGKSGEAFLRDELRKLEATGIDFSKDICGFMLETFQGWGAVFYPTDFVQAIAGFCKSNDALLAFDEMQAGFARTGRRFGFEHYGVEADLIAVGKGMGSGMPLSGVIGRAEIMDLPEVGNMSSTHSANPLVCAAGLATLEEIEENRLVEESERKGRMLREQLEAIRRDFPQFVTSIQGHGMIAAVIFNQSEFPSRVAERAMQKGLLVVHTGRESIKIGPPLSITDDALTEGIATLREAMTEIRDSR